MIKKIIQKKLESAFGHLGIYGGAIVQTMEMLFEKYPYETLEGLNVQDEKDRNYLERMVREIGDRVDVKYMQDSIAQSIEFGKNTLESVIASILLHQLPSANIISSKEVINLNLVKFRELWIVDKNTNQRFALAQIPMGGSNGTGDVAQLASDETLTPKRVYYGHDLEWKVAGSEGPHLILGKKLLIVDAAQLYIFRENLSDTGKRRLVKETLKEAAKGVSGKGKKRQIPLPENTSGLIEAIIPYFPKVRDSGRINYIELYDFFELVRRKNLKLEDYNIGRITSNDFVNGLRDSIDKNIPAPIAIVRTRVKQESSIFWKAIQAIENIKLPGYQGENKEAKDVLGIRVTLPAEKDCYAYVKKLKALNFIYVTDEKDYIKNQKPNGYRSYHLHFEFSGQVYAVQIRTHEMDRAAEFDPEQAHQGEYREVKERNLMKVPPGIIALIAAATGLLKGKNEDLLSFIYSSAPRSPSYSSRRS